MPTCCTSRRALGSHFAGEFVRDPVTGETVYVEDEIVVEGPKVNLGLLGGLGAALLYFLNKGGKSK